MFGCDASSPLRIILVKKHYEELPFKIDFLEICFKIVTKALKRNLLPVLLVMPKILVTDPPNVRIFSTIKGSYTMYMVPYKNVKFIHRFISTSIVEIYYNRMMNTMFEYFMTKNVFQMLTIYIIYLHQFVNNPNEFERHGMVDHIRYDHCGRTRYPTIYYLKYEMSSLT